MGLSPRPHGGTGPPVGGSGPPGEGRGHLGTPGDGHLEQGLAAGAAQGLGQAEAEVTFLLGVPHQEGTRGQGTATAGALGTRGTRGGTPDLGDPHLAPNVPLLCPQSPPPPVPMDLSIVPKELLAPRPPPHPQRPLCCPQGAPVPKATTPCPQRPLRCPQGAPVPKATIPCPQAPLCCPQGAPGP